MRRLVILAVLAIPPLSPTPVQAQEVELYDLTSDQLWGRSAWLGVMANVAAISFAKSQGVSPSEFGAFLADFYIPGWGAPGTGSLQIVRGMARNLATDPQCKPEIVEQSATEITLKVNRSWTRFFGENQQTYGVTLQEYDSVFDTFTADLAEYLGLGYNQRVEGDFSYLTFTLGG